MTYLWAYVAGVLTLINPCVLPLLPIVIAAAFQNSRLGPLALAAGLTLSFAALGVSVTAFGHLASISPEVVNRAARERAGVAGQFGIGVLLGAVWSPCVGPTLGGAIGLAASGESLVQATVTMLMFGVGVSTVLVALAYGSRQAVIARREKLSAWMPWAKPLMGAILLVVGVAILFHVDRAIEGWVLDQMPVWLQDLSVSV